MIFKDRMRLHKLYMKLSHMGSIFREIFDVKVLYAIYPMVYTVYQGNKVSYFHKVFFTELLDIAKIKHISISISL